MLGLMLLARKNASQVNKQDPNVASNTIGPRLSLKNKPNLRDQCGTELDPSRLIRLRPSSPLASWNPVLRFGSHARNAWIVGQRFGVGSMLCRCELASLGQERQVNLVLKQQTPRIPSRYRKARVLFASD